MITDRDLCMAAYTTGRTLSDLHVHDAMSRELHKCRPGDSIEDAEALMQRAQVRRLPVVDHGGQLAGILSLADVVCAPERQRGSTRPVVAQEIVQLVEAVSTPRS